MKKPLFLRKFQFSSRKVLRTVCLVSVLVFSLGMTIYDANDYGSSILICSDDKGAETAVRYWSLVKKYPKKTEKEDLPEDMIFDQSARKSFPISACEKYVCSPEPWRMKGCVIK